MFTLPTQMQIPHMVIASPKDEQELRSLVRTAFAQDHPFALHYPRDPEKSYIKRVIALPGDRLRIERGQVWLNGKPLQEDSYVPDEFRDSRSMAEIVVPEDAYFMMGDHRSISSDSREFGPVERSLIYGKAAFVYWPAKDAGVVR